MSKSSLSVRRVRFDTGEVEPALVDESGIPAVLPLRWVMRKRRLEAAVNTIEGDLRGVAELYEWALSAPTLADELRGRGRRPNLDEDLAAGRQLSPAELESLIDFVRGKSKNAARPRELRSPATIGNRLGSIKMFLEWAANPFERGSTTNVETGEIKAYKDRLAATIDPYRRGSASRRPDPLSSQEDEQLRTVVFPERGPGGRILMPLRFPARNPFQASSRIRNWLIYLLMRDSGLRRSEVLCLMLDDLPRPGREYIEIRRRPDNPAETRNPAPQVKGMEGVIPVGPALKIALRAYQAPRGTGRRKMGSPFLITSRNGDPLSFPGLDAIWDTVTKHLPDDFPPLSSHVLRHTWAEEVATDLIVNRKEPQENALAMLREAGRWSPGSDTPLHYIQNALRTGVNERIRQRQHATYCGENTNT